MARAGEQPLAARAPQGFRREQKFGAFADK